MQRLRIANHFIHVETWSRRDFLDIRQSKKRKDIDIEPTEIELVPAHRKSRRGREGMMVVVQLFTTDPERDRRDICAGIRDCVMAIAPVVAHAIDDAGRMKRYPGHLHRPNCAADWPKQDQVRGKHQPHALPAKCGIDVAFDPVVGRAVAIFIHRFLFPGLDTVKLCALRNHFLDTVNLRAVRVFLGLAFGVMLAMDGHPFLGHLAGCKPQPETKEVARDRVQVHATVRL